MKPKFSNNDNYVLDKSGMEFNDGISMSIPGQAYSLRELLDKVSHGITPTMGKIGIYALDPENEEPDILRRPDIDLVDVHEEIGRIGDKIIEDKRIQDDRKKAKALKEAEKKELETKIKQTEDAEALKKSSDSKSTILT